MINQRRLEFGRRLEALLLDREMKKTELALSVFGEVKVDARGYGYAAGKDLVSKWCKGQAFPTAIHMKKICAALKCNPTDLDPGFYDKTDEPEKPIRKRSSSSTGKDLVVVAPQRRSGGKTYGITVDVGDPDYSEIWIDPQTVPTELGLQIMRLLRDAEK